MKKTKSLDKWINKFVYDLDKLKTKKEKKAYIKKVIITSGIVGLSISVGFALLFNKGSDDLMIGNDNLVITFIPFIEDFIEYFLGLL